MYNKTSVFFIIQMGLSIGKVPNAHIVLNFIILNNLKKVKTKKLKYFNSAIARKQFFVYFSK